MTNDSSRDGRLYFVVQRSLDEKPEVYRCRCCVGWCTLWLNTRCKSLYPVCVNGQNRVRHRQPKCRRDTDQSDLTCTDNTLTWTVSAPGQQTIVAQCEERDEQRDWKPWKPLRESRHTAVFGESGAEEDDSVRLRGKRRTVASTQTEELEIHPC